MKYKKVFIEKEIENLRGSIDGDIGLFDQFLVSRELFIQRLCELIRRRAFGAQALKNQLLFNTLISQSLKNLTVQFLSDGLGCIVWSHHRKPRVELKARQS